MIIDGKKLANKIATGLKKEVAKEKEKGNSFGLGVILVKGNPASEIYVSKKRERAEDIGIGFYLTEFENPAKEILVGKILEWNKDSKINGTIVQLPLSEQLNPYEIINYIDPKKDVDGLTDENQKSLENDESDLYPATPLGILEILKEYDVDVKNKKVVIMGRSKLVGKPISLLLKNKGASVEVCHSQTGNTAEVCRDADILISAVGKPNLVTADMVKDGAVVIDVGTTRTDGVLKGDVDFENVKNKASLITPVPGGVGPLTVACLMKNVIKAKKMQNSD
ncbi:bifunctional methylenetetrahydrofolate dehydrogenase/methenyltetrahydrofolate cyclohydrolase [bacterium (Candidatus Howlettbacteria) CG_4_10_14_0_8_um_filter_40_9]|nr:MAG: bifunctional methylenetetrahydrofolate dehydrogenase/methenyltetrahydrofolate cyclohydrolase [bacterium (Candidatus Howlettbacteria) CG_4_10_14_0_8_um_filter_40_9]